MIDSSSYSDLTRYTVEHCHSDSSFKYFKTEIHKRILPTTFSLMHTRVSSRIMFLKHWLLKYKYVTVYITLSIASVKENSCYNSNVYV